MATKKKRASTKKIRKFVAFASECGGSSQLTPINDQCGGPYSHATAAEAKGCIDNYIDCNGADGNTFVVAEILDIAKADKVSWTGKQDLES